MAVPAQNKKKGNIQSRLSQAGQILPDTRIVSTPETSYLKKKCEESTSRAEIMLSIQSINNINYDSITSNLLILKSVWITVKRRSIATPF
jgi:hypothetical protein